MSLDRPRREYHGRTLLESSAPATPLPLFRRWLVTAFRSGHVEPNAMTLATADARGRPRARMVLLKDATPLGLTFFSNRTSAKGRELAARAEAALVFWWPEHSRQVRVEGRVERLGERESDAYFATRPREAQLGTWASPQSRRLASRDELVERFARASARFAGRDVPRPPHWGGYRLVPRAYEFWQGRRSRLHDRLRYTLRGGRWRRERL